MRRAREDSIFPYGLSIEGQRLFSTHGTPWSLCPFSCEFVALDYVFAEAAFAVVFAAASSPNWCWGWPGYRSCSVCASLSYGNSRISGREILRMLPNGMLTSGLDCGCVGRPVIHRGRPAGGGWAALRLVDTAGQKPRGDPSGRVACHADGRTVLGG